MFLPSGLNVCVWFEDMWVIVIDGAWVHGCFIGVCMIGRLSGISACFLSVLVDGIDGLEYSMMILRRRIECASA